MNDTYFKFCLAIVVNILSILAAAGKVILILNDFNGSFEGNDSKFKNVNDIFYSILIITVSRSNKYFSNFVKEVPSLCYSIPDLNKPDTSLNVYPISLYIV